MSDATVRIRLSDTIRYEYQARDVFGDVPDAPVVNVTIEQARAILSDAEYNSDLEAFDVGPYGMPLGTYNAYRALAKQVRAALTKEPA